MMPASVCPVFLTRTVAVGAGSSSSMMNTVAASVAPSVTPAGNSPKASPTLSSSSSTVSSVALNVNDFSVSPLANVTLSGTPE